MPETKPAAAGEKVTPPAILHVTPLAHAALELGVDADDVLEYLRGAGPYASRAARLETIEVGL